MRPSIPTLLLALIPVALPPACGVEEAEAAETTVSLDPVAKMRAGIEELMDEPAYFPQVRSGFLSN